MQTEFTPIASLAGGALIGLSAVDLMAMLGRIAGITGILAGILPPWGHIEPWRIAFLIGVISGPLIFVAITGSTPVFDIPNGIGHGLMAVSGVIVGVGVTLGSGCTSGHGVCGLARLSPRSLVAVVTFMATAAITVFVVRHVLA